MKILRAIFFLIGLGSMAYMAFAADQMKTTETIIADSAAAINSVQNYPFTFYIGDNLAGVANPLKSLHFTVSGVYTGNGTVTLSIDGNGSKAFTLPNVGATPTPFEIDYTDATGTINPASAGSYSYTLNLNPSIGVTIYGLGIKMTETHRYAPPACVDGSPANQKIKTTEAIIADSATVINTAQNYPFTFYIGDNLAGVANPLKSLHFTVSGVYTGNGTVTLSIDGNGPKAFTLPAVASPTPFEIDYTDATGTINPASAGSYSYSLNLNPSIGVTIYGLGIKMTETHRYAPPACGGMPIYGDLESAVFDSTGTALGAGYNSVLWKGTLGGLGANEGHVKFQFAASDNSGGPWTFIGGDTCASDNWFEPTASDVPIELKGTGLNASTCSTAFNNKRYFRYKVRICSNDCTTAGTFTPTVNDVIVNWAP